MLKASCPNAVRLFTAPEDFSMLIYKTEDVEISIPEREFVQLLETALSVMKASRTDKAFGTTTKPRKIEVVDPQVRWADRGSKQTIKKRKRNEASDSEDSEDSGDFEDSQSSAAEVSPPARAKRRRAFP